MLCCDLLMPLLIFFFTSVPFFDLAIFLQRCNLYYGCFLKKKTSIPRKENLSQVTCVQFKVRYKFRDACRVVHVCDGVIHQQEVARDLQNISLCVAGSIILFGQVISNPPLILTFRPFNKISSHQKRTWCSCKK